MEISAVARLIYNEGQSISGGWEGLYLNVKFKEKGKIFNTSLTESIITTFDLYNSHLVPEEYRCYSYKEYYEKVKKEMSNLEGIKGRAERMVRDHLSSKNDDENQTSMRKELVHNVSTTGKIEIKVKL